MSAKTTKRPSARAKAPAAAAFDWSTVDALTDKQIEAAAAKDADAPPVLGPEWFAKAELVLPGRKRPISIRLDEDVLAYFMAEGPGYQSRINAVLANFVRTKRQLEALNGFALGARPQRAPRLPGLTRRARKR